ncbi:MAG: hypothetical protein JNK49_09430 [Planctomycetes bacterium]|nr:hypothetical protein [Planctomycetota bacterium]
MNGRRLVWLTGLVLVGSLGSGCAWARRDNRPVWNAFEAHLVPEQNPAFALALPLTVPGGLLAIAADTLVAHPLQVVDDAWGDAADLWRGIPFAKHYYTQAATLPVRAVATPVWFVGSFVLRSLFDMRTAGEAEQEELARVQRERTKLLEWLAAVEAGGPPRGWFGEVAVDAEVRAKLAAALAAATPAGRMEVYAVAGPRAWLAREIDWVAALGDASAVVRYRVLEVLPEGVVVPAAVQQRLCEDADPAVQWRARLVWRRGE